MHPKFIFITGGVCSSLGKGIATSSIGALLKTAGHKVFTMKLDPYLNVDPGTMSPYQHGEVFVTDDGAETDLDLGHYERFIDQPLSKLSSITTGKVYLEVLEKERRGDYLGGTIQIIPHITDCITSKILRAQKESKADIVLVEIGGTTGDIEGLPYLEAIRQMRQTQGRNNTLFIHTTLLPFLAASKELKTKPTQASVRELRSLGIQPDLILARSDQDIDQEKIDKIALFCDVDKECVIPMLTLDSIYKVPAKLSEYRIGEIISERLHLKEKLQINNWKKLTKKIENLKKIVQIALVGKYTGLDDAYLSVIESLKIAGFKHNATLDLIWIDSEKLAKDDKETWAKLKQAHGVIVPGGFGYRGIEGKIKALNYTRTNKVPSLGICLGMQMMSVEFLRDHLKNPNITSEEFDENHRQSKDDYAIIFLPGQNFNRSKGGTMRLGAYACELNPKSQTYKHYGKQTLISERHRHRFEFNNAFLEKLAGSQLQIAGINPENNLVEIVELKDHPFYIGCQFHPEFLSRPFTPHPLFDGLILNSLKHAKL